MPYEYKVIPAPTKGVKASGIKGAEARFVHSLEQAINKMAAVGWEYIRSDILPSEERQGLTSTHKVYRSVLVFRREAKDGPIDEVEKDILVATRDEPEDKMLMPRFTRVGAAIASKITSRKEPKLSSEQDEPETEEMPTDASDEIPEDPDKRD